MFARCDPRHIVCFPTTGAFSMEAMHGGGWGTLMARWLCHRLIGRSNHKRFEIRCLVLSQQGNDGYGALIIQRWRIQSSFRAQEVELSQSFMAPTAISWRRSRKAERRRHNPKRCHPRAAAIKAAEAPNGAASPAEATMAVAAEANTGRRGANGSPPLLRRPRRPSMTLNAACRTSPAAAAAARARLIPPRKRARRRQSRAARPTTGRLFCTENRAYY
mmetsp:Transcript_10567/g.31133  ORF Transcript_10567/g.31133 Transcript_10567/m.31133 type:complete len:218 (-) Transcript_10567:252-905(-)